MADVLLATCADLPVGDEDASALLDALARQDIQARWAVWTDPQESWDAALVVLRSTWDYTGDRAGFLRWVGALDRVENDVDIVRWNTDKTYLRDLAAAGVATVPTTFADPGERIELPLAAGEFVVKPSVGAGSRGAGRFTRERADQARAHAARLHTAGRTVLVQPYLDEVETSGETSLIFLGGRFSHAIRKGAMLPHDHPHPVDGDALYIQENITARTPSAAELDVGTQVVRTVGERFADGPLYARIDLLPSISGPQVVEVELTEPSLFLAFGDGAAAAFAAAIATRL